jgi:2-oxoglutarate ferredoxin oxidoreductase subunit beta
MQAVLKRAHAHKGTSFVEVYQNCPVFNDAAFFAFSDKETKKEEAIFLEQGKPLIFGQNEEKGIKFEGITPIIVDVKESGISLNDLWIHDEKDKTKANILSRFFDTTFNDVDFPRPFGIIYANERPVYDENLVAQIDSVTAKKGKTPLNKILSGEKTWSIN